MHPGFAVVDVIDRRVGDLILASERSAGYTLSQGLPDGKNLLLCELGGWAGFSSWQPLRMCEVAISSFAASVLRIVFPCAKPEMRGIATRRIVAGVTDQHSCRYLFKVVMQSISKTVSHRALVEERGVAITILVKRPFPQPALSRSFEFGPKLRGSLRYVGTTVGVSHRVNDTTSGVLA